MEITIELIDIEREKIKRLLTAPRGALSKDHLTGQLFALNQLRDKVLQLKERLEKEAQEHLQYF